MPARLFLVTAGAIGLACAEPAPAEPVTVRATAGQLFLIADKLVRDGRSDEAVSILAALSRDPNSDVRNEARFRQSLLLEAKGSDREAAVVLRRIIDERPDAVAARLKLASVLQRIGDEDSALRELRALRSADLPPVVAQFVDRLSASLQANRPLGFYLELALAPDSNINRATRSETLGTVFGDFILDQKAKSGIGVAVRGLTHASIPVTDALNLQVRASGEANIYRDKDFNDIAAELSVGPELSLGATRLRAETAVGQQWYGMEAYQRSVRFGASIARPVDSVSQARLEVGARLVDNQLNDLQDGRGLTLQARYERALSPRTIVSLAVGRDRFSAHDDAYSTRSWNAGISVYRDIGRATVSFGAEIGRLRADERLALLPQARIDRLTRFHVGTVFRQLTYAGFAPMIRVVRERNKSSVEYYDYDRTRTEFGVSRAF